MSKEGRIPNVEWISESNRMDQNSIMLLFGYSDFGIRPSFVIRH
jgi:hypothetical protein